MVVNDVDVLDDRIDVGLHPTPPPEIDRPPQRLLPYRHVRVYAVTAMHDREVESGC